MIATAEGSGIAVKICGITRAEDGEVAARSGATFLGTILSGGFPRSVTKTQAAEIHGRGKAMGPVRSVGVVVDEDPLLVQDLADALQLDVIQFHGNESPETVSSLKQPSRKVWKVVRIGAEQSFPEAVAPYLGIVDGILADTWHPDLVGGSGAAFDWTIVARESQRLLDGCTFIAAGGLTPENVCEAIRALRPGVVDVSSGVEESLGVKSAQRVRAFIERARHCSES